MQELARGRAHLRPNVLTDLIAGVEVELVHLEIVTSTDEDAAVRM